MKIALVTGHYLPFVGGIESHVQHIARRLAATGDEVTILTQSDDRHWEPEEVLDGVLVRRYSVPLPSRHFAISPALWSALRTKPVPWDIVHAHGYHSVVPLLAAAAGVRPIVFTPHYHGTGHSPLRKALHVPYRQIGKSVLSAATSVICVSEAERQLLLRHFPSASDKTVVVPNGVDLEMLGAAEAFPKVRTTIVTGGRLETYKHVDVVLRAAALLGLDFEVVITGDGPERARLENLAGELRLTDRARFLGRAEVGDLYRWYKTADVYVSMSSNEAMPVTLLELLACGARVVCSDIPAHLDLKDRTNGPIEVVPLAASAEDVSRAIKVALAAAAPQGLQVPTWDDVTGTTRGVYEQVLGSAAVVG